MLIYRFEDEAGDGIYGGVFYEAGLTNDAKRHPAPWKDPKLNWNTNAGGYDRFFFGFSSLWSLRRWFRKNERQLLEWAGAVLRVYEVSEEFVNVGRQQVVFIKEHATVVGRLDAVNLTKTVL